MSGKTAATHELLAHCLPPHQRCAMGRLAAAEAWRDVEQARAILAAHPRLPILVNSEWLKAWLGKKETFVPEHLDHIPTPKREQPAGSQ